MFNWFKKKEVEIVKSRIDEYFDYGFDKEAYKEEALAMSDLEIVKEYEQVRELSYGGNIINSVKFSIAIDVVGERDLYDLYNKREHQRWLLRELEEEEAQTQLLKEQAQFKHDWWTKTGEERQAYKAELYPWIGKS